MNKRYKKIVNFGCSISNLHESDNMYGNLVSKKYKAHFQKEYKDITTNQLILKNVFEYFNNGDNCFDGVLAIIQLTSLSTTSVFYKYTDTLTILSHLDFSKKPYNNERVNYPLFKYYDNYISHIYNESLELDYLLRMIEVYNTLLIEKKIDVLWIPYEWNLHMETNIPNILFLDNMDIKNWALKNKFNSSYTTKDDNNLNTLTKQGHLKFANIVYNKLNQPIEFEK